MSQADDGRSVYLGEQATRPSSQVRPHVVVVVVIIIIDIVLTTTAAAAAAVAAAAATIATNTTTSINIVIIMHQFILRVYCIDTVIVTLQKVFTKAST